MSGDQPGRGGDQPGRGEQRRRSRADGPAQPWSTKRGFLLGIGMALVSTGVAYALAWPSQFSERFGGVLFVLFWAGPLLAALLMGLFDRTRSLAGGFIGGLMLTWIVSVPTCVAVALNTVPFVFG
jgi:tryptophan-rich sensory protein